MILRFASITSVPASKVSETVVASANMNLMVKADIRPKIKCYKKPFECAAAPGADFHAQVNLSMNTNRHRHAPPPANRLFWPAPRLGYQMVVLVWQFRRRQHMARTFAWVHRSRTQLCKGQKPEQFCLELPRVEGGY